MYLMARRIKAMGIKMVLSGEGADEIFGGYLYFHKAPNAREFHEETVRKLDLLHKYDCLRANKSMAAWGVEVRVPFLDREFLDVAMAFNPAREDGRPGQDGEDAPARGLRGLPARRDPLAPEGAVLRRRRLLLDRLAQGRRRRAHPATRRWRTPATASRTTRRRRRRRTSTARSSSRTSRARRPRRCVPGGPSIACSTPTAIAWDASFAGNADPSGRAVLGVHQHAKAPLVD